MKRDRKLRILFLIDFIGGPSGGTEGQLFHLLRRLDRSRFEPFLCCLWSTPWIRDHKLPCPHVVLFSKPIRWFSVGGAIVRLRRLIRRGKFDVVHTFFPCSNTYGVLAAKLASARRMISSRRDLGYWKKTWDRFLLRVTRAIPTCFLANSYAVKSQTAVTEAIDPARIAVVYNGVDVRAYEQDLTEKVSALRTNYGLPDGTPVIGVVANYHRPVKGVAYFVEAAKIVASEVPDVRFFIVGQGPKGPADPLRDRIRQLGLEGHFVLTGVQEDVRPFLSLFDVAVLPSLSEGFSNSLLEYMAAGLPSVATDVGGNRELITDGESGFLVPPASPQPLAEKTILLLRDSRLRKRIAVRARQVVGSRFSVERMISTMEALYENVLRGRIPSEESDWFSPVLSRDQKGEPGRTPLRSAASFMCELP